MTEPSTNPSAVEFTWETSSLRSTNSTKFPTHVEIMINLCTHVTCINPYACRESAMPRRGYKFPRSVSHHSGAEASGRALNQWAITPAPKTFCIVVFWNRISWTSSDLLDSTSWMLVSAHLAGVAPIRSSECVPSKLSPPCHNPRPSSNFWFVAYMDI